jgi:hypothetical protein
MMGMIDGSICHRLKVLGEEAIEHARTLMEKKLLDDAVNWGDIHVYDVVRCESCDGDGWWEIHIEEAAPDAADFCTVIHEYISARISGIGIRIITEW